MDDGSHEKFLSGLGHVAGGLATGFALDTKSTNATANRVRSNIGETFVQLASLDYCVEFLEEQTIAYGRS